jgi:protein TonB
MFSTLENIGESLVHRGRATLTSFTIQAVGLSLLLAVPLLTVQGPPRLQWMRESMLPTPSSSEAPDGPLTVVRRPVRWSNFSEGRIVAPTRVQDAIERLNELAIAASPNFSPDVSPNFADAGVGASGGTGRRGSGVLHSLGDEAVPPPAPAERPARPMKISHWAEGNLILRVQPAYPALARAARIQGTVELRAVISRTGTIENLIVVNGHPMLVRSAIDAVRQWRYRPYLLNGEAVEVETEITVNFLLAGR